MAATLERFGRLILEAAPAALVVVPVFWFLQRRHKRSTAQAAAYLLFALYLCGVYTAAGLPAFHRIRYIPRVNLTLFAYMFSDYRSSLLNVLFFLPLGFLLPMIWKRFRNPVRSVLFGLGVSLVIEAAQLLTPRATDVNDLITNTLGTLIGYLLALLLQWIFPSLRPENDSRDVYWLCGVVAAIMFFVHPIVRFFLYY